MTSHAKVGEVLVVESAAATSVRTRTTCAAGTQMEMTSHAKVGEVLVVEMRAPLRAASAAQPTMGTSTRCRLIRRVQASTKHVRTGRERRSIAERKTHAVVMFAWLRKAWAA